MKTEQVFHYCCVGACLWRVSMYLPARDNLIDHIHQSYIPMNPRSQKKVTLILIIALIALIGFLVYRSRTPNTLTATLGNPFVQNVDSQSITQMNITQQEKITTLSKESNIWLVDQPIRFPADTSVIEDLLEKLNTMRVQSIASKTKNNLEAFELDLEHRTIVDLFQKDQKSLSIFIGKIGPGQTTYVTSEQVDRVYLMNQELTSNFLEDFRDMMILSFDPQEITRLQWTRDTGTLTIEKKESVWSGIESDVFDIDQENFDLTLSEITYLRAQDIPDQNQSVTSPILTISFFVGDTERVLKIFPFEKDAQNILVQNHLGYFYWISLEQFQILDITKEKIAKK